MAPLVPNVKWAQRKDRLFLTVDLQARPWGLPRPERAVGAAKAAPGVPHTPAPRPLGIIWVLKWSLMGW